jgi:5-hydroxyisourate hydrolase
LSGKLTTHVLDTARGRPAEGIQICLTRLGDSRSVLVRAHTNADGRCDVPLLEGEVLRIGVYELTFWVGGYFARSGLELPDPPFLDEIVLRFGVADAGAHYHVPLLVSPYGYSTYRGS